VADFVASHARVGTHRPLLIGGGDLRLDAKPIPPFELFALDDAYALCVVWKEIGRSIRATEVVGFPDLRPRIAPELFDAVWAIHRSPSGQGGLGFDPTALIRAVNALHSMGRERALLALREYCILAKRMTYEEARKYSVDEYRILPIVQVLFESPRGWMPPFVLGGPDVDSPGTDLWPLFPLAVVQDVPFMVVSGYFLAGVPQEAEDHLRINLGPLRSAPLSPRLTALEAADELTHSAAWKALKLQPGNVGRKTWQMRTQALSSMESVFALRPDEKSNDCCVDPTETQWRAAVDRAKGAGIVWSPEIQDFILGR